MILEMEVLLFLAWVQLEWDFRDSDQTWVFLASRSLRDFPAEAHPVGHRSSRKGLSRLSLHRSGNC
jgi:hypothetical protein